MSIAPVSSGNGTEMLSRLSLMCCASASTSARVKRIALSLLTQSEIAGASAAIARAWRSLPRPSGGIPLAAGSAVTAHNCLRPSSIRRSRRARSASISS